MPRPGTTTQRGYDGDHKAAAHRLKAAMRDGDLCCRCRRPMWRWQLAVERNDVRGIDADHYPQARAQGGALPNALAHRRCNRRAGAVLGNQLRALTSRRPRPAGQRATAGGTTPPPPHPTPPRPIQPGPRPPLPTW